MEPSNEPPRLLWQLVTDAARRTPDATAIVAGDDQWSYARLDQATNDLAIVLREAGVASGDRVGILLDKGPWAIAAMQAALRLDAAYVPLDAKNPPKRLEAIIEGCELRAFVTTATFNERLSVAPAQAVLVESVSQALEAPRVEPKSSDPDALAYILYTSGSTGTPKGVCISHRNALAFVNWAAEELRVVADDRLANHAPFHFDISVLDLYVAFSAGAAVVLVPEIAAYVPDALVRMVRDQLVTVWYSVPSALVLMMDARGFDTHQCPTLRTICFAGEPFPLPQLKRLRSAFPRARMLNLYGPTETNVCTWYEVESNLDTRTEPIPIGRASSGDTVWAQRPDGSRAAPGEEGELMVSGPTVMRGYWGQPPAGDVYPTGDVVRATDTGDYVYVSRKDHMVKVKGHRVELGEIEAALLAHDAVTHSAALVVGDGLDAKVVAVLVAQGKAPSLLQIKAHCSRHLPRYMIPDRVVLRPALPLTRNGKLDRRSLAASLTTPGEIA